LAVAIVSAGNGSGILLMAPLGRYLISTFDWAIAFAIVGLLGWVVILPAALLVRNSPADMGYKADGEEEKGAMHRGPARGAADVSALSGRQALKTSTFWVIALTHFCCCAAHAGPIFHMTSFAMDVGIPKMAAATILGISGFVSIAGRIGTGVIADHLGAKSTLVGMLALQAVSIVLYLLAGPLWTFLGLAVLFGVSYGGVMPLYAVLTRQYFGPRVIGTMYGAVFGISAIGMGLGSYLGGLFFDLTGTYAGLYVVSFLLGLSAIALGFGLRPPGVHGVGTWAAQRTV
jgi:predicted MFS family arabinose efflux permease